MQKFHPKIFDKAIVTNRRLTDLGRNIAKLELYDRKKNRKARKTLH